MWRAELKESCAMALNAVAAHKLRSALTLLGVLVGVFSIIVVMTAMRVLQNNIESSIAQLGVNTFAVQKWPEIYFGGNEGFEKYWRRKPITYQVFNLLREKATLAKDIGIEGDFWAGEISSKFGRTPPNVTVLGAAPGNFPAKSWDMDDGRPITGSDMDSKRDVCVLAAKLATSLFPYGSPVGEKIKLDGINYQVIGVLKPRGMAMGGNQDNFAVIPFTTADARYGRPWWTWTVLVQAESGATYDDAVEQVRGILRASRKVPPWKEDDFEIFSNDSLISQFKQFTFSVRIGVLVVSSIALLAAGIGIMNIMLVSVTERTREIGIRRAIGAKKRNIMAQFIMEAIVLCELGGIAGVLLGILGGNVAAYFLQVPPVIPFDWAAIGLAICSLVGIIFGTYPAIKAANLDPIESLRYE
jgi:putative ABC transport system permease protein